MRYAGSLSESVADGGSCPHDYEVSPCGPAEQIPPVEADPGAVLTLAASREGVHAVYQDEDAKADASGSAPGFVQEKLVDGGGAPEPGGRGAGEIKAGRLGDGTPMIATIEPMHGTDAVVYLWDDEQADTPRRVVLTDRLQAGHALWCSDLDDDGDDEVVVGWRQPNPRVGIVVFDRQDDGSWNEQAIDPDGVACEDLIVHDLTGDGTPDILAGGRATHNIKLYVNRGVNKK